jgi:hypothetical protein
MFIIVFGQHVSVLIESSSDPSRNTHSYLAMFKMRCGIPNAYILDITMFKMHVSLCSYCTLRILISETLTGIYEGGYTMHLRCFVIELWILLYIMLLTTKYVYKR